MQNKLHQEIYSEFVYCDPSDHLLKKHNHLTRPKHTCKRIRKKDYIVKGELQGAAKGACSANDFSKETLVPHICIQQDINGDNNKITQNITTSGMSELKERNSTPNATPVIECCNLKNDLENKEVFKEEPKSEPKQVIYSEDVFNTIELRGFITKDLLKQSLDKGSNLFHIQTDIFEKLLDRYNQFKEILHTLETEFDNTVECIIETGKELSKKISHIIYELYLAVMNKHL